VRECPQCSYLLAPDWTTCRRCGASTPAAAAPRPATVAPPPDAMAAPATQWGAGVTTAAPPGATYDPRYATPVRTGFDAPGGTGEWSLPMSTTPVRPTRKGRVPVRAAIVVFIAILLFGGFKYYSAWKHSPPKELAGYVDGKGVDYAPDGLGFSIRLPEDPEESSMVQTVEGFDVTAYTAIAEGEQWEVVVGAVVVPFDVEGMLTEQDLESMADGAIASMADLGGTVKDSKTTTLDGHPALEMSLEASDGNPFEMKLVMVGDTLYLYGAHATRGTDQIMDAMNESFELTDAGV
jgi:hypothetical protein